MNGRWKKACVLQFLFAASLVQSLHAFSYHQQPDEDGIFYVGPEVSTPRLIQAASVSYGANSARKFVQGMTVLAMVVDPQGFPQHVQVLHTENATFDQAAIDAIKASRFAPGQMSGKPVPVWVDVRFVFRSNSGRAFPEVLITERDLAPPTQAQLEDRQHRPRSRTEPILIHTVDADFVNPFSRHPYVQVAVVAVSVNKEGLPQEVRIRRGLGFGLDQRAIAAVRHYRFFPATRNGVPVPASCDLEVDFALF